MGISKQKQTKRRWWIRQKIIHPKNGKEAVPNLSLLKGPPVTRTFSRTCYPLFDPIESQLRLVIDEAL